MDNLTFACFVIQTNGAARCINSLDLPILLQSNTYNSLSSLFGSFFLLLLPFVEANKFDKNSENIKTVIQQHSPLVSPHSKAANGDPRAEIVLHICCNSASELPAHVEHTSNEPETEKASWLAINLSRNHLPLISHPLPTNPLDWPINATSSQNPEANRSGKRG